MPEQKPFEITLGDGSVVKGTTVITDEASRIQSMEEAFTTLSKMKTDTAAALRAEKAEKERLQGEKATLEGQIQSLQNPPRQPKDGEFDAQKYYQLLNSDPLAANDYWFEYRFQQTPDQVTSNWQQMGQQVSTLTQQAVAAAFVAQHSDDFPATADAAKALRMRTEQLVNSGIPYNLDTVNYAYDGLVKEGIIKPNEPTPGKNEPNPALTGGGGNLNIPDASKFEKMSDEDLQKYAKSQGWM